MSTSESDARNKQEPPPAPPPTPAEASAAAGEVVIAVTVEDKGKRTRADVAAEGKETAGAGAGAVDEVVIAVKGESCEEKGKGTRADVAAVVEDVEKMCRICHLSPDQSMEEGEGLEVIQIGCGCKNELGSAHRDCAETWFRLKGNRCCEICGVDAKNITFSEGGNFTDEWHVNVNRVAVSALHRNSSERVGCWRGQPLCNFLMACLVIAFILPWFFRVNMF